MRLLLLPSILSFNNVCKGFSRISIINNQLVLTLCYPGYTESHRMVLLLSHCIESIPVIT